MFAVGFWAAIWVVWTLARTVSEASLTNLQKARLANLGDLPKYRDANAALKPDASRVVFFGDSIINLWDLTSSFPNASYVNRGIGGQTSSDMLVRFREDVVDLRPKAVVILAGVNDFAEHNNRGGDNNDERKLAHLEENDQTMAELAELHHIRPVFISILPLHAYTPAAQRVYSTVTPTLVIEADQWLKEFCTRHQYEYIDAYDEMVDQRGMLRKELSEDGLHPNSIGYQVMTRVFSHEYRDE